MRILSMPYYCEILRVSARMRFGVTTKTADHLFGESKKLGGDEEKTFIGVIRA